MGYDAFIKIKDKVSKKRINEFILYIGYSKYKTNVYYHYNDNDYKSLCYVNLFVDYQTNAVIHLRTLIHCSNYDLWFMNKTLKAFKNYFNFDFSTDEGKGRYFKHDKIIEKAQAGCYKALFDVENDMANLRMFSSLIDDQDSIFDRFPLDRNNNPGYKISAMALPYIVTIVEEYFRNTFIALLKYSNRKEKVINGTRLNGFDILQVSNKQMEIEEAIARSLSFQNIYKIANNFRELEPKLYIKGILSSPYRNRKETLFFTINRILNKRHAFIHSNKVDVFYEKDDLIRDIYSVETALERVYNSILEFYQWEE